MIITNHQQFMLLMRLLALFVRAYIKANTENMQFKHVSQTLLERLDALETEIK